MYREEIVKEYVDKKIERNDDGEFAWSVDDSINFYKKNKEVLQELLWDINEYFVEHKKEIEEESELTHRQIGCIQRITKEFTNILYGSSEKDFSKAFYELLDFIFYPDTELKELTFNEIEIIRMMIAYLINKANDAILMHENHPDDYLDKYRIEKYKEEGNKIYYKFIVANKEVGNGWILNKVSKLIKKDGIKIYIEAEHRRKKYGTKFYEMLARELTNLDIEWVYMIVDKNDKIAIDFIKKQIEGYGRQKQFGNKIIFEDIFVVY